MKISIIILFLSSMVRDVLSVRGLHVAEVSILPEGQVPTDSEDEVTCTISSIEPASSDSNFVKYIASGEEALSKYCGWEDKDTVSTFEDCADEAATSNAKMFLFDEGRCRISDDMFDQTDLCDKDHTQMVYMDSEAVPDTRGLLPDNETIFCNMNWEVKCRDGRLINIITENSETCGDKVSHLATHDNLYYLMTTNYPTTGPDFYGECAKYGAVQCAPVDDASLLDFLDNLQAVYDATTLEFAVGLNSSGQFNFEWSSGVMMHNDHNAWDGGTGSIVNPNSFGCVKYNSKLVPVACTQYYYICCMVPYYAD